MSKDLRLRFENKKGYLWITLPESIDKGNSMIIQNRIESELIDTPQQVAFDLSNMEMINSTTIDVIMYLRRHITESGGTLCVVNISKKCLMQLLSVNLDKVLTIYENEEEISAESMGV